MAVENAWIEACTGLKQTEVWWPQIVQAYSAQERRYHDLKHLERKIELLKELGSAVDPRALTFAIFFQYYEYNPQEGDSADKNVQHFKSFVSECGMDESLATKVESLLATEGCGEDRELLQDLDMAALGSPCEEYVQLQQSIRQEYHFLSDQSYQTLRRKILQSFLLIPSMFSTPAFRQRFESQARANIEQEVANMGKS